MRAWIRVTAALTILPVFLVGCYTGTQVDLQGDGKEDLRTKDIQWVLATDGRKYSFEKPPVVLNDSIFGESKTQAPEGMAVLHVAIPIDSVAAASVMQKDSTMTTIAIVTASVVGLLVVLGIVFAPLKDVGKL